MTTKLAKARAATSNAQQAQRALKRNGRHLRKAISTALAAIKENHEHHIEYDDRAGYLGSALCDTNIAAMRLLETLQ